MINFLILFPTAFRTWRDSSRIVNKKNKTCLLFKILNIVQKLLWVLHALSYFNPCISPKFTCWKPHSKWYSSSLGHLTLKAPLPAIGCACGLLPYSRLSSLGTSAAAPAWARHPTAAVPSGNAAAPASRSPGDRPWQWFPTKSSSHESNNIRTFCFLKQTKSNSPTSANHSRGQVQISERKTTMKHNMCSGKQKD